ncbi:MAG TPA: thiamine ABC transporter substrate-binding protein [Deinococcales bacterium]|nr:thiamine ABC transporter substrate-binding protein [Deinococcales bacterium]
MKKTERSAVPAVPLAVGLLTIGLAAALAAPAKPELTVITHDSFDVSKTLIAQFEKTHDVTVRFIKGGDAGAMLNKLLLSQGQPLADVVYGLDNTLVGKANRAGLLEAYASPAAKAVPEKYRAAVAPLTPVDYGWVALNLDKKWFDQHKLALPKTLEDLTRPAYKGLVVTENPATSSPGLAFLLATVKTLGETGALKFWRALARNDLLVSNGWTDAYNTQFSLYGGARPVVVSYASSPAAEVAYSKTKLTASPTANLLLPGSAFLQVEGVGVLKGTRQPALARAFVDFMVSKAVQADFPTRMWVYPVVPGVKLDPVFRFAQVPTAAEEATPSPDTIAARADALVDEWTKVVQQGADPAAVGGGR